MMVFADTNSKKLLPIPRTSVEKRRRSALSLHKLNRSFLCKVAVDFSLEFAKS